MVYAKDLKRIICLDNITNVFLFYDHKGNVASKVSISQKKQKQFLTTILSFTYSHSERRVSKTPQYDFASVDRRRA